MKTIKDYLHLYIGCEVYDSFNDVVLTLTPMAYAGYMQHWDKPEGCQFKPLLRPLSSMTEDERFDCISLGTSENDSWIGGAKRTKYLLSKHFDLFGLIEKNLALDATKFEKEKIK